MNDLLITSIKKFTRSWVTDGSKKVLLWDYVMILFGSYFIFVSKSTNFIFFSPSRTSRFLKTNIEWNLTILIFPKILKSYKRSPLGERQLRRFNIYRLDFASKKTFSINDGLFKITGFKCLNKIESVVGTKVFFLVRSLPGIS